MLTSLTSPLLSPAFTFLLSLLGPMVCPSAQRALFFCFFSFLCFFTFYFEMISDLQKVSRTAPQVFRSPRPSLPPALLDHVCSLCLLTRRLRLWGPLGGAALVTPLAPRLWCFRSPLLTVGLFSCSARSPPPGFHADWQARLLSRSCSGFSLWWVTAWGSRGP